MIKTHEESGSDLGLDHVAFRVRRGPVMADLRATGVLIAALILAIGVCGSVLPARSGWLPAPSSADAVGKMSVDDQRPGNIRPGSNQG